MTAEEKKSILFSQVTEAYARAVFTHKTHEKCADLALKRLQIIKVVQIVLAALTTSGIAADLYKDTPVALAIAGVLSVTLFALNAYVKDFDLGAVAEKHREAAASLWDVRESYISLMTDIRSGALDTEEARIRRDALQEKLGALYKGSPSTNAAAYAAAQKALSVDEEMTFTKKEIERILPPHLRGQE